MLDKKFIGQWERSNHGMILNIIEKDDDISVKWSWPMMYKYNVTPSYMEFDEDSLYFFHNDRYNRAEYVFTVVNDDELLCTYTQYGETSERQFLRLSHTPVDEEFCYNPPVKPRVDESPLAKFDLLREFAEYDCTDLKKSDTVFEYRFDEREKMLDIITENCLDELVKGKNDIDTAIALMGFVCDHYKHNGQSNLPKDRNAHAIIEYCDKNDGKINCRGLAMLLAQVIRAYGIKAFHITCMPYEDPFNDCHVVVCVYCEYMNKWVMLDPTYRLHLKNKNGEYIGIRELREALISEEELFPNEDANYHGESFIEKHWKNYRKYMAKNTIRLERGNSAYYGCEDDENSVILISVKYMGNEAKNFPESEQKKFTSSPDTFWKI